jgi:MFS family permease
MGMTESQSTWMISAFQLTFASFLLIVSVFPSDSLYSTMFQSGRLSDVYNPSQCCVPLQHGDADGLIEHIFTGGVAGVGVISLCAGFIHNKVPMIICRALLGIGAHSLLCLDPAYLMVAS